jgi:hypothetical protein
MMEAKGNKQRWEGRHRRLVEMSKGTEIRRWKKKTKSRRSGARRDARCWSGKKREKERWNAGYEDWLTPAMKMGSRFGPQTESPGNALGLSAGNGVVLAGYQLSRTGLVSC